MKGKFSVVPWLLLLLLLCVSPARAATIAWTTLRAGACSAVAVTPSPAASYPNVVYAAFAGDNVAGPAVLRSEDSGSTWTAVLPLRAYSLATTPRAPEKLFAATDNGLFSSADYGASWTLLTPGSRGFVSVNAGNDNILYLDNYRSVDGGRTWYAMGGMPGNFAGRDFHLKGTAGDPNFLLAYGGYGDAYVSRDGGATWALQGGARSDFYSVGVDPVDARYHFVGYCNYIQRWYPGGTTMPVASGDIYAIEADPGENAKVFASGQGGAFYYSGDHGYSWEASTSGGELSYYGRMLVDGDEGKLYLPTTSGLRVMSTDALPVPVPKVSASFSTGIDNGAGFLGRVNFMPGQTVLLRARVTDLGSGLPVSGGSALFRVAGPTADNVASGPSDADGYSFASWIPTDPAAYKYTATLVSLAAPAGSTWNGVTSSRTFTEGPMTRASAPLVGTYQGDTFVPLSSVHVGTPTVFRSRITDLFTGMPVPGAVVTFNASVGLTYQIGTATTDADGWAEVVWAPTQSSASSLAYVASIAPPPGYVWDGYYSSSTGFSVLTPPLKQAGVPGIGTGKYQTVRKVTNWVSTDTFNAGDTVVFRVSVSDADGAPVDGAVVALSVYGPLGTGVTTSPSVGGIAEGTWKTNVPKGKVTGTTPGDYLATVTGVTMPAGYAWDGVLKSVPIVIQ